jgi:putative membrane protein
MWRPLAWLLALLVVMPPVQAADLSTPAFVVQAVAVNRFEIASSQLALRKTKNDAVQGFANQVILDYTVAGMKLRQALADAKLPSPREALDAGHKALFDELSKTPPGKPFAKAYVEIQDKALRGDLETFQAYAKGGDNERLKLFAEEMVPVVKGHLEQLAKLRK